MRIFVVLCCAAGALSGLPQAVAQANPSAQPNLSAQPILDARKLHKVMEQYFEDELKLYPVFATSIGDRRYDDQYSVAISEPHRERQRAHYRQTLGALAQVQRARLDAGDRLNYDVFERALLRRIEGLAFDWHLQPVTQLGGAPIDFPLLGSGRGLHPFKSVADYDNFLKRIDGFEAWVETAIANMRRGMALGIVQPRVVMQRTLPQLEAMIADDPARSLFYQPLRLLPDHFSETDRARLSGAYAKAITGQVVPAYRSLRDFIRNE